MDYKQIITAGAEGTVGGQSYVYNWSLIIWIRFTETAFVHKPILVFIISLHMFLRNLLLIILLNGCQSLPIDG